MITGQELYKNHRTCLKVMKILEERYRKPVRMVRLGTDYPEWSDFEKESKLQNKVIQIEKLSLYREIEFDTPIKRHFTVKENYFFSFNGVLIKNFII